MDGMWEFTSETGFDEWTHVRVWKNRIGDTPPEVFEIGEPVHLKNPPSTLRENQIWWIEVFRTEFLEERSDIVRLRSSRIVKWNTSYLEVKPTNLQKLPAMLRIAVEAQED